MGINRFGTTRKANFGYISTLNNCSNFENGYSVPNFPSGHPVLGYHWLPGICVNFMADVSLMASLWGFSLWKGVQPIDKTMDKKG